PGSQFSLWRFSSKKNFRDAFRIAFGFLKHSELVGVDGLVFMKAGLDVPACKVAAIRTGKSSGSKSADGSTLPETVVNMATVEGGLFCARVFQWLSDGALPSNFGNIVVGANARKENADSKEETEESSTQNHKASRQGMGQPEGCPGCFQTLRN